MRTGGTAKSTNCKATHKQQLLQLSLYHISHDLSYIPHCHDPRIYQCLHCRQQPSSYCLSWSSKAEHGETSLCVGGDRVCTTAGRGGRWCVAVAVDLLLCVLMGGDCVHSRIESSYKSLWRWHDGDVQVTTIWCMFSRGGLTMRYRWWLWRLVWCSVITCVVGYSNSRSFISIEFIVMYYHAWFWDSWNEAIHLIAYIQNHLTFTSSHLSPTNSQLHNFRFPMQNLNKS